MGRAVLWVQENGLQGDPDALKKYIKYLNMRKVTKKDVEGYMEANHMLNVNELLKYITNLLNNEDTYTEKKEIVEWNDN
jgi:hypothetical protein